MEVFRKKVEIFSREGAKARRFFTTRFAGGSEGTEFFKKRVRHLAETLRRKERIKRGGEF
jgi:hypothetical protein